jgi:membrane fusion protein, multidrug efflux system
MHLPRGRISVQTIIVLIVIGVGGWFGVREFNERLIFVKETDARIAAPMVTISSRVDGWITDVLIEEGQHVARLEPITQIDARRDRLELEQLDVQISAVAADRERLLAERHMVVEQMRTQLASRTSRVEAANALVESLGPRLELARSELARADKLFGDGVVSKQQLDNARNTVYEREGEYLGAIARLAEAESERTETIAASTRTEILDKEVAMLKPREALLRVKSAQRHLEVEDRTVRTPSSGIIDKVFVETGEYVRAGQRLLVMHDPAAIRIDVNIKETELKRLAVGQAVDIVVDAYPDTPFAGKVARIGNSTTGTYALLPNPNPSGNFTKITQRVPIRIDLAKIDERLHPGMMVEVRIDVR